MLIHIFSYLKIKNFGWLVVLVFYGPLTHFNIKNFVNLRTCFNRHTVKTQACQISNL